METKPKRKGRKPTPFSQKTTQAWASIPIGQIVEIEKNGYVVPDYLAIACKEKMLRDGLLQQ